MNSLVMFVIAVVMTFEYLGQVGVLPIAVKYVPDILSALVLLLVVLHGTRNRFQHLRAAYWFAFGAIALVMISGVLANSVQPGPLFTGVRNYVRAAPLFFLPVVYEFSERDVRRQVRLVLALCMLQLPIALSQRIATRTAGGFTGDTTVGTLQLSGPLSVFLICAACVLAGVWLRKRLSLMTFMPLFLIVVAPTTINETKASIVMLPIGLLVTFVFAAARGARLKNALLATGLIIVFAAIFVPVYDAFESGKRYGVPIAEFFSDEGKLKQYMSRDSELGARKAGRLDAILTPLREMSKDSTHLMIGLGIGNTAASSLGEKFTGAYFRKFEPFLMSSVSVFILEIGVLGLGLTFVLVYLIYRDACAVATADGGLFGALAAGWAGATAVIAIAMFYIPLSVSEAISFLFWYFSGLVAGHRMRLRPARSHEAAQSARMSGNT